MELPPPLPPHTHTLLWEYVKNRNEIKIKLKTEIEVIDKLDYATPLFQEDEDPDHPSPTLDQPWHIYFVIAVSRIHIGLMCIIIKCAICCSLTQFMK